MNFAKTVQLLSFLIFPVSVFAAREINYGKANPPWKSNTWYDVTSQYEMELRNVVLDVQVLRPEKSILGYTWLKEKEMGLYESPPFTARYSCNLNYATFATRIVNMNYGSTFRRYQSSDIALYLDKTGGMVFTDVKPGWWRRHLGISPKSRTMNGADFETELKKYNFFFKEVFDTDGQHIGEDILYFLVWSSKDQFVGNNKMDVYKRFISSKGKDKDKELNALEKLNDMQRAMIEQQSTGTNVWNNWTIVGSEDIGHNVAQAEAKMMSYAIYGQQETRNVGDVWTIDSGTLESFFPQQNANSKPFSFTGGRIVLTVESIDALDIVSVKSLVSGNVDGSRVRTDLTVKPITEKSDAIPEFKIYMENTDSNFVRFTIDSRNMICRLAEMQILFQDYSGDVPRMEKLSLTGIDDNWKTHANIKRGDVRLHCLIRTKVEDME